MPRIPGAESVPQARHARDPGVRVGGPGPGEIMGEAVGGLGESAFRASVRIANRRDAISLSNAVTTANEQWADQLRLMEEENKLIDPQAVEQFGKQLKQQQAEMLESADVSLADNRSRLTTRLESLRGEYASRAAGMAVQAQRKKLEDEVGQNVSRVASSVYDAPETTEDAIASLDASIDDVAGALPPEQERAFRRAARSQVHLSAVEGLIARGAIDEAEDRLTDPGVAEVLGPDDTRKLRSHITVQRVERNRAADAVTREANALRQAFPNASNEMIFAAVTGVQPQERKKSFSAKVAEFEAAMQARNPNYVATDDDIRQLADMDVVQGNVFGGGLTGRSLELMTDLAPSFAIGLTSPEQERRLQSAITQYQQPQTFQDPETGQMVTRRPELPPFVQEAVRMRQEMAEGAQQDPGTPGQVIQPGEAAAQPRATQPDERQGALPLEGGQPRAEAQPEAEAPGQNIWDLAPLVAGPVPVAGTALGRTPVVGEFMPAPQMTIAQTKVPQIKRDLVRVLQNSPRYAQAEREAIEADIDFDPSAWDTPTAFRNRLIGIDEALVERQENARETAEGNSDRPVSLEERRHAMNVYNGIVQFREQLGVPPKVKNEAQYKKWLAEGKLASGEVFRTPDNRLKQVP